MKDNRKKSEKLELLNNNSSIIINKFLIDKDNKITNKKIGKRNPSIDLARIFGMYSIIINHILAHGKVLKKYKYRRFTILLIFCQWHISIFTLISGIVGYNKFINYYNLFYLWLIVLFYSVIIYLFFKAFKLKNLDDDIIKYLFPVIFGKYWYFTKYFGMYLLLPIINKGILYANESDLKLIVLSTLGIFVLWEDLINQRGDVFLLNSGRSSLWFLVFYITGSYIGKYKLKINIKKNIYRIKILIKIKILFHYRNNSITSVIQAISLTLFLYQLNYNYLAEREITFLGPFTFSVYLIHEHNLIRKYIIGNLFAKDSKYLSKNIILMLVLIRGFSIFLVCIIIDYLRNFIFSLLKIKKFCILVEKKIKNIFLS